MTETNGDAPRAVLYARVSTDEQVRGYSLRQQLAALRSWCEAEGYRVLEEVEDPGHSGAYLERPGLDRVRDLVESGNVSVVWRRTPTGSRASPCTGRSWTRRRSATAAA